TDGRSDLPSLAVSSRGSVRKSTRAKPDQLSGGVLPEAVAAGVTDKLIQIARTNLYRQKVLLLAVTLAITTGLLCWIILRLLWPLISTLTK
ncbi:MAG TPA: hypothetical protein VKP88_00295, partial [Candidatus Paceibacterota bacterium]|nr:hypothetical protein [Candidatus Paceibacterota bacterium]